MNAQEMTLFGKYAMEGFPHQKITEFTLDVWFDALGPYDYQDAMTSLKELVTRQQFIAPADIIAGVRRIRRDRIERAYDEAPDADPDDVPGYLAALRAGRTRKASGELKSRPVAALLGGMAKSIDAA